MKLETSNNTKIVATMGPASWHKDVMKDMIKAGVNVFRVNFSHGDHETHRRTIRLVKELNEEFNCKTAVLADLQGPKLRIGDVEEGAVINEGDTLTFTTNKVSGTAELVYMNYKQFPQDVNNGEHILLDDGKLMCEVIETNKKDTVVTKVIQGGPLKSKKGVNLPNTKVSLPCLTKKDLEDVIVAMEEGVEWIGLSFVRDAADVNELRKIINDFGSFAKIVSKIEKPEAVVDIDKIIDATDAIMVARGDLGVEIPYSSVPMVQKMIVEKCHLKAKPCIIATQMMESMIDSQSPTRAEVNDVANSVCDGADAVMLSGETSVGKFPAKVVETMANIVAHVESTFDVKPNIENEPSVKNERYITKTICYNAAKIADQIDAAAILTMTFSGYTALKIAGHRPKTKIIVFTANRQIMNQMSLVWGVEAFFYDKMESTDQSFKDIKAILKESGTVKEGDLIVNIASMPIEERGFTNMLKISAID
ncbi:MAG: pyruvate kinase [Schleiferiaceae bacterium]|jgi:pyruvate kinase|nr:pyruvate kinase [Schleiferiaceae bacterium]MDP4759750.1 pyruvate kinase [Schleiferiaceae bacterium]MDP4877507.1 pyruvate kinase [Schleiferiaceae bacterium]